jgi:tetratricopeptide (TPR) repeat protein
MSASQMSLMYSSYSYIFSVVVTVASLHDKMSHPSLAVPMYQEALTIYRDIHGYNHQSVADTMCLLADSLSHVKSSSSSTNSGADDETNTPANNENHGCENYQECVNMFHDAIRIYRRLELEDSKVCIKARKQLAALYERTDHLEEAKKCYEMVMRTYVNTHIGKICDANERLC